MKAEQNKLNPQEEAIALEAFEFIRSHRHEIIAKFAGDESCPPVNDPVSMFMAGSPGAGKTEFSKGLIQEGSDGNGPMVRIDGDEIRGMIPNFNGKNASIFQRAVSKGVGFLHDHALDKKKNFILDSTFSSFRFAEENVSRSLKHGRPVVIFYLYQDPVVAWDFTKKRELVDHRNIPKQAFIDELFQAKENVNRIKAEFGGKVKLWLVERDLSQPKAIKQSLVNIDNVDSYLSIGYTKEQLQELLQ